MKEMAQVQRQIIDIRTVNRDLNNELRYQVKIAVDLRKRQADGDQQAGKKLDALLVRREQLSKQLVQNQTRLNELFTEQRRFMRTIKQYSKKRASLEVRYRNVLKEIYEERDHCCAGCGTWSGRITPSHRIPRSYRIDLLTDKRNIDWMCDICHELVEIGHYDKLDNGEEIVVYIRSVDEQYYQIKIQKRVENGQIKKQCDPNWTPW